MQNASDIDPFLNAEGQVTAWPAKPKKQMAVLTMLAEKFEWKRTY